jgi:hypothetical protein
MRGRCEEKREARLASATEMPEHPNDQGLIRDFASELGAGSTGAVSISPECKANVWSDRHEAALD